jgi:hypothetical protein
MPVDAQLCVMQKVEAAREISEATSKSNVSAKTDARFRSPGEKSPGIRA